MAALTASAKPLPFRLCLEAYAPYQGTGRSYLCPTWLSSTILVVSANGLCEL
jgi:hypothetical protein